MPTFPDKLETVRSPLLDADNVPWLVIGAVIVMIDVSSEEITP